MTTVVSLVTANPRAKRSPFILTDELDEIVERICDHIDQIIKYALVPRKQAQHFIRKKLGHRGSPFGSPPIVSWGVDQHWAYESLRMHIHEPLARLPKTSEYDKYMLLFIVYQRSRDRMRPTMTEMAAAQSA